MFLRLTLLHVRGLIAGRRSKEVKFWHSAQGGKEIYQLQVPAGIKVPSSWAKQSGTKVSAVLERGKG